MYEALRVVDHVDPLVRHVVEPPRFDDLVALVHQRGRVDRHLRTHLPRWVPERVLRGHAWQRLQGHVAEGAARCGERHTPDPLEPLPDEALPKAVVLAVDRTQALPRP